MGSRRSLKSLVPLALLALAVSQLAAAAAEPAARRVVSLNPSLTSILVALGAGDSLVGIDSFSAKQHPALAKLPTVGGLYSPSLEALVALAPDLVVLVPSAEQRDFHARLDELEIRVQSFDPTHFAEVLDSISRLGRMTGHDQEAEARIAAILDAKRRVRLATAERPHPRTVLVLQREPLFVVGGGNFIHEMLESVAADNLGRGFSETYPRVSLEWLVAAAPEVILDSSGDPQPADEYWSRWPSLPAVRDGRVVKLPVGDATLPGPYLDRALRMLANAVHGLSLEADE